MHNYYKDLELSDFADVEVVKAAYKALSKKYHPDLDKEANPQKMVNINLAYEKLGNPDSKRVYDDELKRYQSLNNRSNNNPEDINNLNKTNLEKPLQSAVQILRTLFSSLVLLFISIMTSAFIILIIDIENGSWSFILYTFVGFINGLLMKKMCGYNNHFLGILASVITCFSFLFPYYCFLYETLPIFYGEMNIFKYLIISTKEVMGLLLFDGFVKMIFILLTPLATYIATTE